MSRLKWRALGVLLAAVAVGCGGEASETSLGSGGNGGDGTTASTGSGGAGLGTSSSSTGTMVATGGSGGMGSGGASANCPEGGLYALSDTDLNEDLISMCQYKGDVLLIVNIAQA